MAEGLSLVAKVQGVLLFILELIILLYQVNAKILKSIYLFFVPPEPKDLRKEIVLITGTGHGIGRELAQKFAKISAVVVCVDINEKGNQETVKLVKKFNNKVHHYTCDVTDRAAVFETADRIRKEVGDVSILVNNAGIMPCRPFVQHSEKEIRSVLDINVLGNLWVLQAFLPNMMERNHGHIVAMSSMAGLMGVSNLVPYCASKWGVRGLMEALESELDLSVKDYSGIHFTTVCPSMVDTGLCQKPRNKRPGLLDVVPTEDAADQILDAVRRNYHAITIPSYLSATNTVFQLLPHSAQTTLVDFLGSSLDPHD